MVFVRPETVIRRDRARSRHYWTWRSRGRSPGRPRISRETQALIRQLVQENPRWGAPRLVGELQALGHDVSIRTVRRYRHAARRRPPSQRWRTFLRNHSPHIWATDLFTVQTVTFGTLYVLVVISHDRRRILHGNVTCHPNARSVLVDSEVSREPLTHNSDIAAGSSRWTAQRSPSPRDRRSRRLPANDADHGGCGVPSRRLRELSPLIRDRAGRDPDQVSFDSLVADCDDGGGSCPRPDHLSKARTRYAARPARRRAGGDSSTTCSPDLRPSR